MHWISNWPYIRPPLVLDQMMDIRLGKILHTISGRMDNRYKKTGLLDKCDIWFILKLFILPLTIGTYPISPLLPFNKLTDLPSYEPTDGPCLVNQRYSIAVYQFYL